MKKTILLLLLLTASVNYSQSKSTGTLNLLSNVSVNITLNSSNSTMTLVLTGPSDRWIACRFGQFPSAFAGGLDGVMYDGTFKDMNSDYSNHTDPTNNWTVSSNVVVGTVRTITATRAFNTGDPDDYVINYSDPTISVAVARRQIASFTYLTTFATGSHHGTARAQNTAATFTTLGVEDFSLKTASVYPNPTTGNLYINTKTNLEKVKVYSHNGAFIKSYNIDNQTEKEINLTGLPQGIYMLELSNKEDKSWTKIVLE